DLLAEGSERIQNARRQHSPEVEEYGRRVMFWCTYHVRYLLARQERRLLSADPVHDGRRPCGGPRRDRRRNASAAHRYKGPLAASIVRCRSHHEFALPGQ